MVLVILDGAAQLASHLRSAAGPMIKPRAMASPVRLRQRPALEHKG
jgi:hypothetical protein